MCLYIGNAKVKIAKQDIQVWKEVWATSNPNEFVSMNYYFPYQKGKHYKMEKAMEILRKKEWGHKDEWVIEKAYHSYAFKPRLNIGLKNATEFNGVKVVGVVAVPCIIPKGTEYYKGSFNSGFGFRASRELIFFATVPPKPGIFQRLFKRKKLTNIEEYLKYKHELSNTYVTKLPEKVEEKV